ncbi:MAG: DUF2933 domain-containing protein [Chloroflexota bacterium]
MENKPSTGISRHALLMILCCAIPLALIAAVTVLQIDLGTVGYWAILLLCPLMHLFMMRGMHGHGDHQAGHTQENPTAASPRTTGVAEAEAAPAVDQPAAG